MKRWFKLVGFAAVAVGSIAAVVARARHDAADPARCAGLVAIFDRCCAPGQTVVSGRCTGRPSSCPPGLDVTASGCVGEQRRVFVAGGLLHAGAGDWEAEGRVRPHDATIASFELDVLETTEGAYAACVAAGRCRELSLSGEPGRALGGVTRSEAEAFCAFVGGRLPTEDEWTFAAGGPKARRYPWGETGAVCRRGVWGIVSGPCGFASTGPELAGAHPDGASAEGVQDLSGNVAEWVAAQPGEKEGVVRGGSFASELATDLRTWQRRSVPPASRSAEMGFRCAYDAPLEPQPRDSLAGP